MSRGRAKGSKLSEKQKLEIRQKKLKNKNSKKNELAIDNGAKVDVYITGKELDAFDFFNSLRNYLRPKHKYMLCHKLERLITDVAIWQDVNSIVNVLNTFVTIKINYDDVMIPTPKKVMVEREKRVLTPEHIKAMQDARKRNREAREKDKENK
jgi:hypothetical protein